MKLWHFLAILNIFELFLEFDFLKYRGSSAYAAFEILEKTIICSHLSNNRGGWNKRGGSAKVAKSINMEVGINVEGGIFWKLLVHKCNKRGVEGGKNLRNQ